MIHANRIRVPRVPTAASQFIRSVGPGGRRPTSASRRALRRIPTAFCSLRTTLNAPLARVVPRSIDRPTPVLATSPLLAAGPPRDPSAPNLISVLADRNRTAGRVVFPRRITRDKEPVALRPIREGQCGAVGGEGPTHPALFQFKKGERESPRGQPRARATLPRRAPSRAR